MRKMMGSIILLLLALGTVGCTSYYHGPVSNHYNGKHFYYPVDPKQDYSFLTYKIFATKDKEQSVSFAKPPTRVPGNTLLVTMIGHATVLLQTQNTNILTDPVWSARASPFTWIGPKRMVPPGVHFSDLPKVDVLLISHNHYDHFDLVTIQKLWYRDHPKIIVPLGNDTIIKHFDSHIQVTALDWSNKIRINRHVVVYFGPAKHWSARWLMDQDKALWGAYTIKTPGGNIYFAGDTGYDHGDHFVKAARQFGPYRLALLPIGSYTPESSMHFSHMNPEEAVRAFQKLHTRYAVAIHYGVFLLAHDGYYDPPRDLEISLMKHHLSLKQFYLLKVGCSWLVP